MLFLGHTGITLGLAWFTQSLWQKRHNTRVQTPAPQIASRVANGPVGSAIMPTYTRIHYLDFRLVLLGSMLPDLIDKPVGIFLLGQVFSNGRIFSHTALFTLSFLVAGIIFYQKRAGVALLTIGYGSLMHLVLDGMWTDLRTLLWPLQGWAFTKGDMSHWLSRMLFALTHDGQAYISEGLGAAILIVFFVIILRRGQVWRWLKTGQLI